MIEGFKGDKRVFQDATRTLEIHVIKGLPHADGLVVGVAAEGKDPGLCGHVQLPAGRNARAGSAGDRHAGVLREHRSGWGSTRPVGILSIHTMNPDRLATLQDIRASLGLTN